MCSSRNSWQELYLSAMREADPNTTIKLVNLAFEAIRSRLRVLPNGLSDLQEMKQIKVALGRLLALRDRSLRELEKHDRRTAVASTLRRLIRAS